MQESPIYKKILNRELTIGQRFLLETSMTTAPRESREELPLKWKRIHFKSYPRFKRIVLPDEANQKGSCLERLITVRRSCREFMGKPISLKGISQILFYSAGITTGNGTWDDTKRAYPSAGARYPIELYPVIFLGTDIGAGIYHYNVKQHSLELVLSGDFRRQFEEYTGQDWIRNSNMAILISAVFGRTTVKYGDRGVRYVFIEAGHIGQNLSLSAEASGLGCCAIGGFIDDDFNNLLDIDKQKEAVIYIFILGYPK